MNYCKVKYWEQSDDKLFLHIKWITVGDGTEHRHYCERMAWHVLGMDRSDSQDWYWSDIRQISLSYIKKKQLLPVWSLAQILNSTLRDMP